MQNIFVEFLPPWVETGLQPAFYDKESGTVLQQVARMYAKVNWLIRMFNKFSKDTTDYVNEFAKTTTETVNDYIAKFVALKDFVDDYFENLDVQEEINNKLDDMLDAGTLQEIIYQFLQSNAPWTYETVNDMKSATNLINGSFAQTVGYYSPNDGGGSLYYITDTEPDNEYYETLGDLYAVLVIEPVMNVHQFGAKGDGITDDADALIACFTHSNNVVFGEGETYRSSKNIVIGNSGTIDLNGSKIEMYNRLSETEGLIVIFRINSDFVEIKNGELKGDIDDRETHSQRIYGISVNGNHIAIHNMKIHKFDADGVTGAGNNISLYDSEISHCGRNNISFLYGNDIIIHDVYTHDCVGVTNPGHGIDIEPYDDNQDVTGLVIYNVHTKSNYGSGINLSFYNTVAVSANVHDNFVEDIFSIKTNHNPSGIINVTNLTNTRDLVIQDPVSSDLYINISDVLIKGYIPVVSTSFYGSAVKTRSGVVDNTNTSIYNVNIKNITIEGGEPTRGFYVDDAGGAGENNSIINYTCKLSTISPLTGSNYGCKKWYIENLKSDYIPTVTNTIAIQHISNTINLTGTATINQNVPYGARIKLINNTSSPKQVTGQGNNQFGITFFCVPSLTECYITVNADGTYFIEADQIRLDLTPGNAYSINLKDTNFIKAIRSSHYEVYSVDYNHMIELAKDSAGTGETLSVSNGVLNVSTLTNAIIVYLIS